MTMRITNLVTKLIEVSETNPKLSIDFFKEYSLDYTHIIEYCTWSPGEYTRNLIHRTKQFELVLLCWDIKANTPLHDHNSHLCAMRIVKGSLEEKTLTKNSDASNLEYSQTYHQGDVSLIDKNGRIHSLFNSSTEPVVSLHLYVPPIDVCGIYQSSGLQVDSKKLIYTTKRNNEVYE